MIVNHRGKKIVRCAHGMKVPGKVQVDVFHRDDLSPAAAGRAALYAEDRPKRRLPQSEHRVLPNHGKAVGDADRRGGLALARGGRADRRHQNQFAVRGVAAAVFQQVPVIDLRLVLPVVLDVLVGNTGLFRNLVYVERVRGVYRLRNFDVRSDKLFDPCHVFPLAND